MSRPPRGFGLIDTIVIFVIVIVILVLTWHWRSGFQFPVWNPS